MICHLILGMVETDEGFNSPLPLRSIKVAGDRFQDFSNSYTLTDQYYHGVLSNATILM